VAEQLHADEKQLRHMISANVADDGASSADSIEHIPLLNDDEKTSATTGAETEHGDEGAKDIARKRTKSFPTPG
jgi:hypothetical protein